MAVSGSKVAREVARFESHEAARRNSDRPEQDQWWAETAKLFTGEATFKDSNDVTVDLTGDPDDAGFVQVIQGRGSDPDRARELMGQDSSEWAAFRPEILGILAVGHEGGAYTMDGGDGGVERRGAGVLRPQATLAVCPTLRWTRSAWGAGILVGVGRQG